MADSWDSPIDDINKQLNRSLKITEVRLVSVSSHLRKSFVVRTFCNVILPRLEHTRSLRHYFFSVRQATDFSDEVDLNAKKSPKIKQKSNANTSSSSTDNAPGKLLDRIRTEVDVALLNALENPRDRLNLLKAEDELVKFMRNTRMQHHEFPPMSSYHRLLLHRLAQRFSLMHTAVDMPVYNNYGQFTGECCKIVVTKVEQSQIPKFLLVHFAQLQNNNRNANQKKVLVMKRRTNASQANKNKNSRANSSGAKSDAQKSIEERERAYAQARARIFGDGDDGGDDSATGESSDKLDSVSTSDASNNTSAPRGPANSKSTASSKSKSSPSSTSTAPATFASRGPPPPRDSEMAEYARGPDPRTVGFYGSGRGRSLEPAAPMYSRSPRGYERDYAPRPRHNSMSPPVPPSNSHGYQNDMYRHMGPPEHPQYYHGQPMPHPAPMGYMAAGPRGPVHMQTSPSHRDQPRNDGFNRSYNLYRPPMYYGSSKDSYNQNFPTLR